VTEHEAIHSRAVQMPLSALGSTANNTPEAYKTTEAALQRLAIVTTSVAQQQRGYACTQRAYRSEREGAEDEEEEERGEGLDGRVVAVLEDDGRHHGHGQLVQTGVGVSAQTGVCV
jgi:hypothetical protein